MWRNDASGLISIACPTCSSGALTADSCPLRHYGNRKSSAASNDETTGGLDVFMAGPDTEGGRDDISLELQHEPREKRAERNSR
jgi:hypothetical protein